MAKSISLEKAGLMDVSRAVHEIKEVELMDTMDRLFGKMSKVRTLNEPVHGPPTADGVAPHAEEEVEPHKKERDLQRRAYGVMAHRFMQDRMRVSDTASNWNQIINDPGEQEARDRLKDIVGVELTTRDRFFTTLRYRLHGAIRVEKDDGKWRRLWVDETHPLLEGFDKRIAETNKVLSKDDGIKIEERKEAEAKDHPRAIAYGRAWYYESEVPVPDKSARLSDSEIPEHLKALDDLRAGFIREKDAITRDSDRLIAEGRPEESIIAKQEQLEHLVQDNDRGIIKNARRLVESKRYNALWALEAARDDIANRVNAQVAGDPLLALMNPGMAVAPPKDTPRDYEEAGMRASAFMKEFLHGGRIDLAQSPEPVPQGQREGQVAILDRFKQRLIGSRDDLTENKDKRIAELARQMAGMEKYREKSERMREMAASMNIESQIRDLNRILKPSGDQNIIGSAKKMAMDHGHNALYAIHSGTEEIVEEMIGSAEHVESAHLAEVKDAGNHAMLTLSGNNPAEMAKEALANMKHGTIVFCPTSPDLDTMETFADSDKIRALVVGDRQAMTRHRGLIFKERSKMLFYDPDMTEDKVTSGHHVILDNFTSDAPRIIANPSTGTIKKFESHLRNLNIARRRNIQDANLHAETKAVAERGVEPVTVQLAVNIANPKDVENATELGAKGGGLVRGEEFLFKYGSIPSEKKLEEDLYKFYHDMANKFKKKSKEGKDGYGLNIRLFDLGGDKVTDTWKPLFDGKDPERFRGLVVLEENEWLLRAQSRAIMRVAATHRNIEVTAPLVETPQDIRFVRKVMSESAEDLKERGVGYSTDLTFGIMAETKKGIKNLGDLLKEGVDKVSIGHNDLTCDVMDIAQADFESGEKDADPHVMRLAKLARQTMESRLTDSGQDRHYPLANCGDAAGNRVLGLMLVGLGYRKLSMTYGEMPGMRRALRDSPIDVLEELAENALDARNGAEAIKGFKEGLKEKAGIDLDKNIYKY